MPSANVRISSAAHDALRELARKEGRPMQAILDNAIEHYRRERFLRDANSDFAALRESSGSWNEELADRALWERTLGDGLEEE